MVISKSELYTTRVGSPVRLYALDGGGEYPVHGAYWEGVEPMWHPMSWRMDGTFVHPAHPRSIDLIDPEDAPRTVQEPVRA